jgi:hypothetical protein
VEEAIGILGNLLANLGRNGRKFFLKGALARDNLWRTLEDF